jgi:hypothetical protein
VYKAPNHPGVASHDCLRFKLLGVLIHNTALFLNIVPFFVGDSANLNATVLQLNLKQAVDMRAARGMGRTLPPRFHLQMDGASTNWCKAMFGFSAKLVAENIFKEVLYDRNPVGSYLIHFYTVQCFIASDSLFSLRYYSR